MARNRYQTADQWLKKNWESIYDNHIEIKRQASELRERWRKEREAREEAKKQAEDTEEVPDVFRGSDEGYQLFKSRLGDSIATSRKTTDVLNQKLHDVAMEKVGAQNKGSENGESGLAITDHFFQDVMAGYSDDAMGQFNGAMLLRDPQMLEGKTSKEIRLLQKSASTYADDYEKTGMMDLQQRRAEAEEEGDSQGIRDVDQEIKSLKSNASMWRSGAQRMDWKANLLERQEKISGYEDAARNAADFDEVSAEYAGKTGNMDDLRLYNHWLSTVANTGETWEEFYARQNPQTSSKGKQELAEGLRQLLKK